MMRISVVSMAVVFVSVLGSAHADETQAQIAAPAGTAVRKVHAVGAQIYECKPDGRGSFAWSFREPIATLLDDGKTVGRHFAGPAWEMGDGSLVIGKLAGSAPGSSADDIPWLRLDATTNGKGVLAGVTTVQRIATVGGKKAGPCSSDGALLAVPYASDYVFSKP